MLARAKWQVSTVAVLEEVFAERLRQYAAYGANEDVYDGSGPDTRWLLPFANVSAEEIEESLRADYEEFAAEAGLPTWVHLVREEVAEAFRESDPVRLEEELIQVAALCCSWVEALRRRGAKPLPPATDDLI